MRQLPANLQGKLIESYYDGGETPLDYNHPDFDATRVATAIVRHAYAMGIEEGRDRAEGRYPMVNGRMGARVKHPVGGEEVHAQDAIEDLDGILCVILSHLVGRMRYTEMVIARAHQELERAVVKEA